MKNRKQSKNYKGQLNNQGFSLIELLVSIVILILIMVPLMHNFFGSAKVNKTAEKLQDYSNMSANIVEDMKPLDLNETIAKYQINRRKNDGGVFSDYSSVTVPESVNYFGWEETTESGVKCDVLVTIKTDSYKYAAGDPIHNGILMNGYEMPNISTIDDKVYGVLFSNMYLNSTTNTFSSMPGVSAKDLDQVAWDYFNSEAIKYANEQFNKTSTYQNYLQSIDGWKTKCQEAKMNLLPTPTPPSEPVNPNLALDYCTDISKKWIKKTMTITIEPPIDGGDSVISYKVNYICDWTNSSTSGLNLFLDNELTYDIGKRTYPKWVKKLYFFYKSSLFKVGDPAHSDDITVTNSCSQPIDLYIVKQGADSTQLINLKRSDSPPINVYTNLADTQVTEVGVTGGGDDIDNKIVTKEIKNRIASVEVQIYKHQDLPALKYRSEDLQYTLNSNREEE